MTYCLLSRSRPATCVGITRIVDGDVVNGMLTILFTAPAMAITQAVIGFLAIPFGLLAESGE